MLPFGSSGWRGTIECLGIKSNCMDVVVHSIVWSLSEWVRSRKGFKRIDLHDLHRYWTAILNGGWCRKFVKRVIWMHPPQGILTINFDGSFICSTRRGGIGGGVRESIRIVVRSFSGLLEAQDADEVEVFALLVGCHKLCQMGCFNAVLEGYHFLAIQWGSNNSSYPWRLAVGSRRCRIYRGSWVPLKVLGTRSLDWSTQLFNPKSVQKQKICSGNKITSTHHKDTRSLREKP